MKLYISKLITIFFAFIIFNSSIISTSQKIQKNKLLELLLVNKESISKNSSSHASTKLRKLAKAGLDNAEFVINALASSGIPVIFNYCRNDWDTRICN